MTREEKQSFTLRITNANKSELTVILCDMFLAYANETLRELENWNLHREIPDMPQSLKDAFRHTKACLREMIQSLPAGIASEEVRKLIQNILGLYRFAESEIIKAQAGRNPEGLKNAILVIESLNQAYAKAGKQDKSRAMMENTEQIYAGMTYGRNAIHESSNAGTNRGFWG